MRRLFGFAFVAIILSACSSMPTSGPTAKKILHSADRLQTEQQIAQTVSELEQKAVVVDITAHVAGVSSKYSKHKLFSDTWRDSVELNVVGVGDVLALTIWEAPPSVLFGGVTNAIGTASAQDVKLPPQMVDRNGKVTIPFIGAIKVSGRSLSQIEQEIAVRLSKMANQPQVMVTLVKNNSSNVTVIGDGGVSLNMPLTPKGERVLDAIAAVGGKISSKTSVQVTRGSIVRSLPLLVITQDSRQNIVLKPGDVVSTLNQPYTFTVLGAAGQNNEISLEESGVTLAQALGRIRGINNNQADPAGVFIFRYEDADTIAQMDQTRAHEPAGVKIPVVYRANFRDSNTFFYAQQFYVQDKDVLFVADAPAWKLQKVFAMIGAFVAPLSTFSASIVNTSNAVDKVQGW